jgi:hypothetical protein
MDCAIRSAERETGALGSPAPNVTSPLAFGVFVVIAVLSAFLPLRGFSQLAVSLVEYLDPDRSVCVRGFLGLAANICALDAMART